MILDRHWWKTTDGRLVPDGDPAAEILAYPRYTEIPDATAERLGIVAGVPKSKPAPANKARAKASDK